MNSKEHLVGFVVEIFITAGITLLLRSEVGETDQDNGRGETQ